MSQDTRGKTRAKTVKQLGEFITVSMLVSPQIHPEKTREAPREVWHYTDAVGAAGIIQGRQLWATDGLFMNDAAELQLVHRDFNTVLRSNVSEGYATAAERDRLVTAFEADVRSFREDPGIFVVCFCESGDLLSQWNTYGQGGGGYALGFDSATLASFDEAVIGTLDFFKVEYAREAQIDAVAEFCSRALHQLELFLEDCAEEDRGPAFDRTGAALAEMAQWYSARVKDAGFSEEREWRFICRNPTAPDKPSAYARRFRATKRGLSPYIALELDKLGKTSATAREFPLRRVRVGPTANVELASRAINYLLKDSGCDIHAEQSSIPLR